jgi:CubicO group peptidase (beta-lactamase class C family)
MKRILRYFLIVMGGGILAFLIYVAATFPPIMAGMVAKTMCSCVFVMGRSPDSVNEKELSVFPGLSSARVEFVDSSSVTAHILWASKKAIYRRGLGCTLLSERSEAEVRRQKIILPSSPGINQDSLSWPAGNKSDTLLPGINYKIIEEAIHDSFAETDPAGPKNTLAVVVVYDGQIIGEKYAEGFDVNSRLMGWSMTKSFVNAIVGVVVNEGKLTMDQPAPVEAWQNDERKDITLNDLMHASSGLDWDEWYFFPGDFQNMLTHRDDKGGYAASKKQARKPNEFFEYSSGTTNLLSKIVRQSMDDSIYYRFPYEKLFYKIGMQHVLLEPDASGTFVGSSYGYASARDWARFGLLYLNDGVWMGERILPEGWVRYSSTPAPAAPLGEYGAQFWLNAGAPGNPEKCYHPGLPHDEYGMEGFEYQYVLIIPSRKLVVVRLGISHHEIDINGLVQKITSALP